MKIRQILQALEVGAISVLALWSAPAAHASLTLTSDGIAKGFTLTTVVTNGFSAGYGPLAEAILPNGNFITGSAYGPGGGKLYIFRDVDNQALSDALSVIPYTFATGNPQFIMATAGGQAYGAQVQGGVFGRFANDGSFTPIPGLTLTSYYGMWGNSVNGHLVASTFSGLADIDPLTGSFRIINSSVFPDGVTVSPDGFTVYAEVGGNINAYRMSDGVLLRSFSGGGHGPDGTGVIAGGLLDGSIIVNNNDGTLGLIDVISGVQTIIASGGTRGDFVSADTNNGSLFVSQTELIARLSCGLGCSIGGPPTQTPEPASWALVAVALAGLCMSRNRQR